MPLVAAKCTSCGANLKVDSTHDAAVCPYCKTPFIVEKAIQKYETNVHVETLQTDVVNILDSNSADNLAKAGDAFIDLGDFKAAEGKFKSMTTEFPYDYRGWWGLVRAHTGDFTFEITSKKELCQINYYAENARKTCNDPKPLMDRFHPYYEKRMSITNRLIDKYEKENQALEKEYQHINDQINAEIHELEQKKKQESSRNYSLPGGVLTAMIIIITIIEVKYIVHMSYYDSIMDSLWAIVKYGLILCAVQGGLAGAIINASEKKHQYKCSDLSKQLEEKKEQQHKNNQKFSQARERYKKLLESTE